LLASVLVLTVQALWIPAPAGDQTVSLAGMVVSSETEAPLVGARLHVGDPTSGHVFTTQPTTEDGSFRLEKLPAASYRLAVEIEGGLYVVEAPVKLAPGEARSVTVAINPQSAPSPGEQQEKKKKKGAGFWNNPVTASLVIIGSATVLGLLINEGTDDPVASPSSV
jgi:hypothetical protein